MVQEKANNGTDAKHRCCNEVCARICYQIALTVLIVGTILLVILILRVLMPYLDVKDYRPTTCVVLNHTVTDDPQCAIKSEVTHTPCIKTPGAKSKPCVRIFVKYNDTSAKRSLHVALVHDNEFNVIKDKEVRQTQLFVAAFRMIR